MKLSLVFLFVGVLQISASVYSQDVKISINLKNVPLRTALNQLEKVSHCTFFYNEDFIDLNQKVSVNVNGSDMTSLLNALFNGTGLTYHQIQDKMIVVAPAKFQQKVTVKGKITDAASGESIPGANVVEKGTTNGTMTDANGNYSITISDAKATLVYSFVGYQKKEVQDNGQNEINIKLSQNVTALQEVVVTALGIKKTERSLTYSSQQVSGNEITDAHDENLMNALSGKSAGLVINRSASGPGGSSRIVIRGNKSISGDNQPLYVIDGMPINNSSMGQIGGSQLSGSMDGGDAISNLNPDDIQSISVLKGASASALYGSAGENGVILITTKKGVAGRTTVEFNSSTSVSSALVLPKLQSVYGATTPVDNTQKKNDPSTWSSTKKAGSAISTSDLRKFFQPAVSTINGISLSSGNNKNQYYMSYANTYSNGIVQHNTLQKNNLYLKADSKLNDKITVEGTATLVAQDVKDRPMIGFNSNPVGEAYLYGGTHSAWKQLKNNYQVYDNANSIWVQNYPYSGYNSTSFILDNPYWTTNNNPNDLNRFRSIFTGSIKWDITKNLNARARTDYDRIDDQFEQDLNASTSSVMSDPYGMYTLQKQTTTQIYSDVLLNYANDHINDFSINASVGASNSYSYGYALNIASVQGNNNFKVPNVFSLTNMQGVFTHTESTTETLDQSVFGTGSFGYKNMLFLDVTGRNEWNSSIPSQSYFYPSIGGSFVLSELIGQNNILDFAKLRASYSEVGNGLPYGVNNTGDNIAYTTVNGILTSPQTGIAPVNGKTGQFATLKPERSKSTELGANFRLLNNSIDLDVTYYNNKIDNQFFTVAAPLGGYVPNYWVNAGEVSNKGVELMVSYKLAPSDNFMYKTSVNFAYNKNSIVSVDDAANLNTLTITQYANTKIAEIRMVKGGQFGDLYAYTFKRDANNKIMVDTTGKPQSSANLVRVGNPNSPTSFGWENTFKYKGFTLNFLIDGKIGGNVISLTESDLDAMGRSQRTADARNAGKVVFDGQTVAQGTEQIKNWYQGLSAIGSNYVYSATNVRLREVSLGYDIPTGFTNGAIKKLNVSFYGKNLFFLVKKAPFDPEISAGSSTGLQGIEALNMPSTRSFGFSVKASF